MKIGIVCYPTFGGSGVVAAELGMRLQDRGHEVHFICYDKPARLAHLDHNFILHRVNVVSYPLFRFPPYTLALSAMISSVCREHRLDIIHAHYAIPHSTSAILSRQMLPPERRPAIVTTLHGTDIQLLGMDPAYREVTRYSLEQSDLVTAVSQRLAQITAEAYELTRPIRVIPNFVDPEVFRPRLAERENPCRGRARPADPLLCHISNMRPIKRVLDVVAIFAQINRRIRCRLAVLGEGPELPAMRAEVHARGLQDRVRFLKFRPRVQGLLARAALFLLPSEFESFGLTALEALSCGTPVLAYEVGGIPEVVTNGVNGVLRPLGDTEGLAEEGARILADPQRLEEMSRNARETARQRFHIERIVPMYETAYQLAAEAQQTRSNP